MLRDRRVLICAVRLLTGAMLKLILRYHRGQRDSRSSRENRHRLRIKNSVIGDDCEISPYTVVEVRIWQRPVLLARLPVCVLVLVAGRCTRR